MEDREDLVQRCFDINDKCYGRRDDLIQQLYGMLAELKSNLELLEYGELTWCYDDEHIEEEQIRQLKSTIRQHIRRLIDCLKACTFKQKA